MGDKVKFPYFQVPNSVFDDRELDLKPFEKLVLTYIYRCSNQGAEAYPSYKTIADRCGISRTSAVNVIKSLTRKGCIKRTKRPKSNNDNDTNIYKVTLKPGMGDLLAPSKGDIPGLVNEENQSSQIDIPNKELSYKELTDKESTDHFFEIIWDLYPRKVGKGKISTATKKKLFKIGLEELARAIDRYKADKPEWQEWQHGSTFFNSGYVDYLDINYKGVGHNGNIRKPGISTPGRMGRSNYSPEARKTRKNEDYYRQGNEAFYE
jgi:hypothetical protein